MTHQDIDMQVFIFCLAAKVHIPVIHFFNIPQYILYFIFDHVDGHKVIQIPHQPPLVIYTCDQRKESHHHYQNILYIRSYLSEVQTTNELISAKSPLYRQVQ